MESNKKYPYKFWKRAEDELPIESHAHILCWTDYYTILSYSAEHKMFNVFDYFTKEEAERVAIDVEWWMFIPKIEED